MSQIKYYIVTFLILFNLHTFAQTANSEDVDLLEMRIEGHITQASFDSNRGDYYNAKDNLEKALELAIKINSKKSQGIIHTKIARLQFTVEEPENALVSLTKAAEIQREIDDYQNLAVTYNTRGVIQTNLKEYDDALQLFKSSKSLFEQENLEEYISDVCLNEAKVYIKLEDFKAAKALLEKTIILSKKYNQNNLLSSALINNGKVQEKLGNPDLGLSLVNDGLKIAKENKLIESINESYITLSDIYEKNENYKLSNEFLRKHLSLSDSILDIKRENLSPEKRAQFINEYNKAENQQLKAEIEAKDEDSNLTKITTILSIALITILSLLTLSLYKNNNIRLKTNNMLHKKNDELVIAKEKAELASKTKANFLSTVTHELRTPLYAVTGLTNMLLDENPKPDQIPHLKSLKFSGDYLLTFINDILQINKIEANKVELDPEIFNLKKKVENVISALNNSALDNNITMHYEYDKSLPHTFEADQLKISQILINLIGNAIKFTKDGDIWVRINKINENNGIYNIRFEIEDNGIGITKKNKNICLKVFLKGQFKLTENMEEQDLVFLL